MPLDPTQSGPPPSRHRPDKIWTYKTKGDMELKAHGFFPKDAQPAIGGQPLSSFIPGGWSMGEPAWGYDICHRYARLAAWWPSPSNTGCLRSGVYSRSTPFPTRGLPSDGRGSMQAPWGSTRIGWWGAGYPPEPIWRSARPCSQATDDPGDDPAFSPVPNALALQCAPVNSAPDSQFAELLQGRDRPEDYSPAQHVRSGLPPMCFVHGTADEIVPFDSVKEFVARMKEAGNLASCMRSRGRIIFSRRSPIRSKHSTDRRFLARSRVCRKEDRHVKGSSPAGDEWEKDPRVLFMRRVFAAIETRQGELLDRLNIHWTDRGLKVSGSMALRLFERIWAGAVKGGLRLGKRTRLTSMSIASPVCSIRGA